MHSNSSAMTLPLRNAMILVWFLLICVIHQNARTNKEGGFSPMSITSRLNHYCFCRFIQQCRRWTRVFFTAAALRRDDFRFSRHAENRVSGISTNRKNVSFAYFWRTTSSRKPISIFYDYHTEQILFLTRSYFVCMRNDDEVCHLRITMGGYHPHSPLQERARARPLQTRSTRTLLRIGFTIDKDQVATALHW